MLWKEFKCKDCGQTQENVPSKAEDKERECPSCGGTARLVLYPVRVKFRGSGWTTPRAVETFPGEPDDVRKWGQESHGVEASLNRDMDKDW